MASFNKLNDGTWGIRTDYSVSSGDIVVVSKRDGRNKTMQVTAVLSAKGGRWICRAVEARIPASLAVSLLSAQTRTAIIEAEAAAPKQNVLVVDYQLARHEQAEEDMWQRRRDAMEQDDAMGEVWHAQYE